MTLKTIAICLLFGTALLCSGAIIAQQDFEDWATKDQQEFQDFVKADEAAFNAYKADIEKKWRQFQESSRPEWVTYGSNQDTKGVVNFEQGYLEVEAVVEASAPDPIAAAKEKIAAHIQEIVDTSVESGELTQSGEKEVAAKTIVQLKKIQPQDPAMEQELMQRIEETQEILSGAAEKAVSGASVLKDLLKTQAGNLVSNLNALSFGQEVAATAKVEDQSFPGNDGVERIKVKVQVPMVPDHLKTRAEQYLPDVKAFCQKYDLDVAMIMGLMHTESYFNPKAKSNAPAYGLMQLVPSSGGLDAFKYVFGKEKKPSPRYLYVPRNNIELGTGYLRKMRTAEFKKVTNSQNALYCIICAYNTGAGNVAKALTGKKKLGAAIEKINTMTPDELYEKFRRDLPYEETRNYIKLVTERSANYVAWR